MGSTVWAPALFSGPNLLVRSPDLIGKREALWHRALEATSLGETGWEGCAVGIVGDI